MARVREDTQSKAPTAPQVQHGQKRIALTTRKTKPDGTQEVAHKVEHSFDPIPIMRKMKRRGGSEIGKDAANSRDTHAIIAHSGNADYGLPDAYVGDGGQERPAPAFGLNLAPDGYPQQDEPAGAGYGLQPTLTPDQVWMMLQLRNSLVPRYKGGVRIQKNRGNA